MNLPESLNVGSFPEGEHSTSEPLSDIDITRRGVHEILSQANEVYPGIEYIPELDVEAVVADMQRDRVKKTEREFTVTGYNKKLGQEKTARFTAEYVLKPDFADTVVYITISSPDDNGAIIPVRYIRDDHEAIVDSASLHTLSGYGYYSAIITNLLQGIEKTENAITNNEVAIYRHPADTPHSVLAASSPVPAARKGFITFLDRSGTNLTARRVEPDVAFTLDLAASLENGKELMSAQELADELEPWLSYYENDDEIYDALDRQIAHLRSKS